MCKRERADEEVSSRANGERDVKAVGGGLVQREGASGVMALFSGDISAPPSLVSQRTSPPKKMAAKAVVWRISSKTKC